MYMSMCMYVYVVVWAVYVCVRVWDPAGRGRRCCPSPRTGCNGVLAVGRHLPWDVSQGGGAAGREGRNLILVSAPPLDATPLSAVRRAKVRCRTQHHSSAVRTWRRSHLRAHPTLACASAVLAPAVRLRAAHTSHPCTCWGALTLCGSAMRSLCNHALRC